MFIFLLSVVFFNQVDATIQKNIYDEARLADAKKHFQFVVHNERSRFGNFISKMDWVTQEAKEKYGKLIEPLKARQKLSNLWHETFEYILSDLAISHQAQAWMSKKESEGSLKKRHLRAWIYEQTKAACLNGYKLEHDLKETIYRVNQIEKMQKESYVKEECSALLKEPKIDATTIIEVREEDTIQAAKRLLDEKLSPVALNFANKYTAGGGVICGAQAQEEDLFRRSSYCFGLDVKYHPDLKNAFSAKKYEIPEFGLVYTPHVEIIRGSESEGYPFIEPFEVDFIASAAYDFSKRTCDVPKEGYAEKMKRKIRSIMRLAVETEHNAIVLGAFGCGAFKNCPEDVARLFKQVIEEVEFQGQFVKITFAIMDNKESNNYSIFKKILLADRNP
ncbi:MAG: TIGR02452 family protein [Parachlamydiaceae bacterium]